MSAPQKPVDLPVASFEWISLDTAQEMLTKNISNRAVRERRVDTYAAKMRSGAWYITHQGIAIGIDGTIYDGQHRLMAIVKSGVGQWMLVVRGLRPKTRESIDRGDTRSARDNLAIVDNVKIPNIKAGTAGVLFRLTVNAKSQAFDSDSMRAIFKQYEPGFDCIFSIFTSNLKGVTKAPILAALVFAYVAAPDFVRQAAIDLRDGAALDVGDPILTLRNFLQQMSTKSYNGATQQELFKRSLAAIDARLNARKLAKSVVMTGALRGKPAFERYAKANGIDFSKLDSTTND